MNKKFEAFGVASKIYDTPEQAAGQTYTDRDGNLVPTPLVFLENPYIEEVLSAKSILEIGFGVGRNVPWIMENLESNYYGVEPNPSMRDAFWNYNDKQYKDRINLYRDVSDIPNLSYDVVLSTYVFQHIGYMPGEGIMNVNDITNEIRKKTHPGTVWILFEHDSEDKWIERWFNDQKIIPTVYIRGYTGLPQLTHRDHTTRDGHHLIIWKEE